MDFGPKLDKILKLIPKERTTYLFSATMTTKVAKLQRASLSNPVRVEVNSKYVHCTVSLPSVSTSHDPQIFDCINTLAILSPHATTSKGCASHLPRQHTGPKFYDHFYPHSTRCPTVSIPSYNHHIW